MTIFENVDYIRRQDISDLLEKAIIEFMNIESRNYSKNNIHISETPQCPRKAILNHFLTVEFKSLDEFLEMWIGKGCHQYFREIIRGYPEQRYVHNYRDVDMGVEGTVDLETGKGIYEVKTIDTFYKLSWYNKYNYPQFQFRLVNWNKGTIGKGPHGSHCDQSNGYLLLMQRSLIYLLYISKIQNEGIAVYKINFDLTDPTDKDLYNENKELMLDRVSMISAGLVELEGVDEYNYEKISEIINRVTSGKAEPSGLCAYCQFGGYADAKHIRGRISKDEMTDMEKFFYENGCDIPIRERGTTGNRWKQRVFNLPEAKVDPNTGEVVDGFLFDKDKVRQIYDNLVEFLVNKVFVPYRASNLFECPRRNYYINKYPNLFELFTSTFETKRRIIWYWMWENIKRYFLYSISNELLETNQFEVLEEVKTYKVNLKTKDDNSVNIVYKDNIFLIDDMPSLIIPTTEVFHPSLPFISHRNHLLLYKQWYPESNVNVIYLPLRKPKKHKDEDFGKIPHINTYSVKFNAEYNNQEFLDYLKTKVIKSEKNIPDPKIWCTWCPLLTARLSNGDTACPEGQIWFKGYLSSFSKEKSKSTKHGTYIRKTVPTPIGESSIEEIKDDDVSDQMIW